ncbi:MAG: hypothetical protein PHW53_00790 [Patescibacteria group bacterium]|nr:hypothetical protein [Patescibacteria group bacterium]
MNWQKFLNLVKKTGDRLIVTDQGEGEAYVIMSFSAYEELTDRLNNQNRVEEASEKWAGNGDLGNNDFAEVKEPVGEPSFDETPVSEEERFYLEPIE